LVVIWAITDDGKQRSLKHPDRWWLMVRHITRGWELPGGSLLPGEEVELGALRELQEETGMSGEIIGSSCNLLPDGWVVAINCQRDEKINNWESNDNSIIESKWMNTAPELVHWGIKELNRISSFDFTTNSINE
jgi:8-oxo-dGTP pyrophosphatase MutT (NUDIX family)